MWKFRISAPTCQHYIDYKLEILRKWGLLASNSFILNFPQIDQMGDYKKGTHLRSKDKTRQLVGGPTEGSELVELGHKTPEGLEYDAEAKRKKSGMFLISPPKYSILLMRLFL